MLTAARRGWERIVLRASALVALFSVLLALVAVAAPADIATVAAAQPTADVATGTAPLTVSFGLVAPAEIEDPADVDTLAAAVESASTASYDWYFGDGARASGEAPRHTFHRPGVYAVYVLTYDGVTAALSEPLEIRVDPAPGGNLFVSTSPDRSDAEPLHGATLDVETPIYVFLDAPAGEVSAVDFVLGDPRVEPIYRTETVPPYDLMGGHVEVATALDPADLGVGRHEVHAIVHSDLGEHHRRARFELVSTHAPEIPRVIISPNPQEPPSPNEPPPPAPDPGPGPEPIEPAEVSKIDMVQVSNSPDRSDSVRLDGSSFREDDLVYVFAELDAERISHVDFYLDDPLAQGSPRRSEGLAPYDLVGGTAALALPLDLFALGPGIHLVTAIVVFDDGSRAGVIVSFSVTAVPAGDELIIDV